MGGGGGSSGKVSYAAYLELNHQAIIGNSVTYPVTQNLFQTLNIMMATSPYAAALAFDPAADLADMVTALSTFDANIADLVSVAKITADVGTFSDILDAEITSKTLPAFNARMRDIGAVQTSSFAVGTALIWASRDREVAKYETTLTLKRDEIAYQGWKDKLHYSIDVSRMAIAAKNDQGQLNVEYDMLDANWDIECLMKAGQILGCLGGGTHLPDKPSKIGSALSGALSGAAAGAMTGTGPIGIGAGAAIGAAAAFL